MKLRALAAACVLLTMFALAYGRVMVKLVHDWMADDNYSHGILIVPIALYLAWERRKRLAALTPRGSVVGLLVIAMSSFILIVGLLGAELFLTRIAMLGTLLGIIVYVFGWEVTRGLWFPLAFLLLMIPIPAIIFNQIAFPLQIAASRFGEASLSLARVPVLREGNLIILANTTLEVAEACSGIRSLVSLLTLSILLAYFSDERPWVRGVVGLSAVPVAIVTNGMRVAGTGLAAHYWGPQAAQGFFHEFSGWLIFVSAVVILLLLLRLIAWFTPPRPIGRLEGPRVIA
jgi:exosortase